MKQIITHIFLIIFILLTFNAQARVTDGMVEEYEQSKKFYYDNDYEKAVKGFQELIDQVGDNGYLHYNLGNAYFKMGKLGYARWQYEKARLLIPRYPDLKINLDLIKTKLTDQTERSFVDYMISTFYFWTSLLTLTGYRILLILLALCFWIWCFQKYFRKQKFITTDTIILFLVFAYMTSGYYLKNNLEQAGGYGVILTPEVGVKASYLEKDEPLFKLHQGTKVKIVDEQDFGDDQIWMKIALPQGQKGWVLDSDIGVI